MMLGINSSYKESSPFSLIISVSLMERGLGDEGAFQHTREGHKIVISLQTLL
jgi:hypothetical protein